MSLHFSDFSLGRSVRGLTSRAESNGEWGLTIPSLQCLLVWNSPCLPRAASKLAHKTNTGSDSRCCCPRLRREFQRLGVNLPLQGRRGPREKEEASGSEGARLESADVGVERFGLNTGLSAALGSVVPEGHSSEEEAEGSASEAADVETKRFGLSTAPSAAAESAFPEGASSKQVPEGSLRETVERGESRSPSRLTFYDEPPYSWKQS